MNSGELKCKTGLGGEYTDEEHQIHGGQAVIRGGQAVEDTLSPFDDKDDLWMEQLSLRGKYDEEEDDRKCLVSLEDDRSGKEDDKNDEEDDLKE